MASRSSRRRVFAIAAAVAAATCAHPARTPPSTDIASALQTLYSSLPPDGGAITPADLHGRMTSGVKPFLLDVRNASELEANGHLRGSVDVPLGTLLVNLDQLPAPPQPIVVVCASGHRSALAMAALRLLGHVDVGSLAGGMRAWTAAGYEVAKDPAGAAVVSGVSRPGKTDSPLAVALQRVFDTMPAGWATIAPATLHDLLNTSTPLVLDVRSADELAGGGAIAGSLPIPLASLINNRGILPPDNGAPIVVVCRNGHRSAMAMLGLRLLGCSNVRSLAGGIAAWAAQFGT